MLLHLTHWYNLQIYKIASHSNNGLTALCCVNNSVILNLLVSLLDNNRLIGHYNLPFYKRQSSKHKHMIKVRHKYASLSVCLFWPKENITSDKSYLSIHYFLVSHIV